MPGAKRKRAQHLAASLTHAEARLLREYIASRGRRAWIQHIDFDSLAHIVSFLDETATLNLFRAMYGEPLPRRVPEPIRPLALEAHNVLAIHGGIQRLGDAALYMLPSPKHLNLHPSLRLPPSGFCIASDWSCFAGRPPAILANIWWDRLPPHGKMHTHAKAIASAARRAQTSGHTGVRLSMHLFDREGLSPMPHAMANVYFDHAAFMCPLEF